MNQRAALSRNELPRLKRTHFAMREGNHFGDLLAQLVVNLVRRLRGQRRVNAAPSSALQYAFELRADGVRVQKLLQLVAREKFCARQLLGSLKRVLGEGFVQVVLEFAPVSP